MTETFQIEELGELAKTMANVMDTNCTNDSLNALINIIDDLQRLPAEYDKLLLPLFNEIKKDDELSIAALTKCKQTFERWDEQDDSGLKESVIKRAMDLWLTIKDEDYPLKRPFSTPTNLVIQEVEAGDYVGQDDLKRIEFDAITGEPIRNSLGNLIIEEVEAADYFDSGDLTE